MKTLIKMGYHTTLMLPDVEDVAVLMGVFAKAQMVTSSGYGDDEVWTVVEKQDVTLTAVPDHKFALDASYDVGTGTLVKQLEKKASDSSSASYKAQQQTKAVQGILDGVLSIIQSGQPGKQTKAEMSSMIANALASAEKDPSDA